MSETLADHLLPLQNSLSHYPILFSTQPSTEIGLFIHRIMSLVPLLMHLNEGTKQALYFSCSLLFVWALEQSLAHSCYSAYIYCVSYWMWFPSISSIMHILS